MQNKRRPLCAYTLLSEIKTPVPSRTVLELLLRSEFKASPDCEILSSIFSF